MNRLRLILLATVSSTALTASAVAADMPAAAPAPVAPVTTWSGPYAGLSLGATFNHSRFTDLDQFFFLLSGPRNNEFWNHTNAAFTGGLLAGYNWQLGSFVFGIEGDWNWLNGKKTATIPSNTPVFASSELNWMTTARGRLGYAILPSTLLYATGGAAWARFSDAWGSPLNASLTMSNTYTRSGWTVGGGIEQMFTPHLSARVEALYADFRKHEIVSTFGGFYRTDFQHSVTQVRGALIAKW